MPVMYGSEVETDETLKAAHCFEPDSDTQDWADASAAVETRTAMPSFLRARRPRPPTETSTIFCCSILAHRFCSVGLASVWSSWPTPMVASHATPSYYKIVSRTAIQKANNERGEANGGRAG
jgi:hypothetical protein